MADHNISPEEARQHVPIGGYCYRYVHVDGRELKEFEGELVRQYPEDRAARYWAWEAKTKRDYCPYWSATNHGTARCSYLGIEGVGVSEGDWNLAVQHFGSEEAVMKACTDNLLGDGCKECGLNKGDPPEILSEQSPTKPPPASSSLCPMLTDEEQKSLVQEAREVSAWMKQQLANSQTTSTTDIPPGVEKQRRKE